MSRRTFVAGNWKMNKNRAQAVELAKAVVKGAEAYGSVDVAVCPPAVYLDVVGQEVSGSRVALGAQNMYHEAKGAYTGEVSASMLLDIGCTYVILGHSERRHVIGETDEAINKKVLAALGAELLPIVCVGEKLEERDAGRTQDVIRRQVEGSLSGLTPQQMTRVVIAYEPVWAIGTGRNATPQQAEDVHVDLRTMLADRYNDRVAEDVRIQYGGSVTPDNAAELLAQSNVDGALVGGASLDPEEFLKIVAAGS